MSLSLSKKFTWKDYALIIGVGGGLMLFGIFMRCVIMFNYLCARFKSNETKK